MGKFNFRTLNADEIECRVGMCTDKGCSLLMYKDARVDMRLLDEVVGAENWTRSHELINGNLFCTVSVLCDNGQWVSKQDVGTESNTEKEKGQASDAFKRACFNWGIGRELYTCPFVWVSLKAGETSQGYNGKPQLAKGVKFIVSAIEYDDQRRVSFIEVKDNQGNTRYSWGASAKAAQAKAAALNEVKACQSREELVAVFKKHTALAHDNDFVQACTQRTEELKQTA